MKKPPFRLISGDFAPSCIRSNGAAGRTEMAKQEKVGHRIRFALFKNERAKDRRGENRVFNKAVSATTNVKIYDADR
jgi:hypothetical protein